MEGTIAGVKILSSNLPRTKFKSPTWLEANDLMLPELALTFNTGLGHPPYRGESWETGDTLVSGPIYFCKRWVYYVLALESGKWICHRFWAQRAGDHHLLLVCNTLEPPGLLSVTLTAASPPPPTAAKHRGHCHRHSERSSSEQRRAREVISFIQT